MTRTRSYRNGALAKENFPVDEVSDHLADGAGVVWVGLCEPDEKSLASVGTELGLHELAIEDAVQRNQRAKIDHYDGHQFITAHWAQLHGVELRAEEISVFVTEQALVTVTSAEFDLDLLVERFDRIPVRGVAVLLHAVLDLIVDSHLDAVQALDEKLDVLEEKLFDDRVSGPTVARKAARLRRTLSRLRRLVVPMHDIVVGLLRHEPELVGKDLRPYYKDVLDHATHADDWLGSLREVAATIRETELGIQSNRLNVIMKKVTGWAAVIAVPTAITGFYGQNVPYPGIDQPWGFWLSTAVIAASSVGLYAFFKRRDWL